MKCPLKCRALNIMFKVDQWTIRENDRVGTLLFSFSSKSLVFCEQQSKLAICSFPRANCSQAKKRGKEVKNCQKHGENLKIAHILREKALQYSAIRSQKLSESLTSLFVKERFALALFCEERQERSAHGRSFLL